MMAAKAELVIHLRSRDVVFVPDIAQHVLLHPELIGIDHEEVVGLDPVRNRQQLVALALSADWMAVEHRPHDRLLQCYYTGRWPVGFRCARLAISHTRATPDTVIALLNYRYRRRLEIPCCEFVSHAERRNYGALIQRSRRVAVDDVLASARLLFAERHVRRQRAWESDEAARLIEMPRSLAPVDGDRGHGRLVPIGGETYLSPVRCFGQVHCRSLARLEALLTSTPWAFVAVRECEKLSSKIDAFRFREGPVTIGILSEAVGQDRRHVSWVATLFIRMNQQLHGADVFQNTILARAEACGSGVTLLIRSGDSFLLRTPDGELISLPPHAPNIPEVENLFSIGVPDGYWYEMLGTVYPVNLLGAMGFTAGRWGWLAGSIPVPKRLMGQDQ